MIPRMLSGARRHVRYFNEELFIVSSSKNHFYILKCAYRTNGNESYQR